MPDITNYGIIGAIVIVINGSFLAIFKFWIEKKIIESIASEVQLKEKQRWLSINFWLFGLTELPEALLNLKNGLKNLLWRAKIF